MGVKRGLPRAERGPKNLTASSVPELLAAAEKAREKGWTDPWWRGHAVGDWELIPKVFRGQDDPDIEMYMVLRFQVGAATRYHRPCPPPDDVPAWLSLMQHYRLPTRLLDWSTSILVAAYFAVEDARYRRRAGAIWGMSPSRVNEQMAEISGILVPSEEKAKTLYDDAFRGRVNDPGKIVAVAPHEIDFRMTVQQSMFTLHGSVAPLDTLFERNASWPFLKIMIPANAKIRIRESLRVLGVDRSTLFPDLESLSASIAAYYGQS